MMRIRMVSIPPSGSTGHQLIMVDLRASEEMCALIWQACVLEELVVEGGFEKWRPVPIVVQP